MNINYFFNCEYAKRFGVDEAIMLENLIFWINKNKANGKHFHNGRYWTYNSIKAFEELFPFWSKRQIERILKSLEKQNILYIGNYNRSHYDRTKWYAINEKVISISPNEEMEKRETGNENNETVEPIPDNKPDDKPDDNINKKEKEENSDVAKANTEIDKNMNKKEKKKTKKEPTQTEIDEVISAYTSNEELKTAIIEFVKFRKGMGKGKFMTTYAVKLLTKKLDRFANDDNTKIEIINKSILSGWSDIYELKEPCKNKGGFNNESRSNTSKNNEPSKGESKDEHDAKYWEEQNRILNEGIDF